MSVELSSLALDLEIAMMVDKLLIARAAEMSQSQCQSPYRRRSYLQ